MRLKLIPKLFIALALIHMAVVSITGHFLSSHPTQDLKVSFFSDGVLVFGKNKIGHSAIEFLRDWDELVSYMSKNTLYIFEKGFEGGTQNNYFAPTQIGITHNKISNYFAVLWLTQSSQNHFGFLHTTHQPMVIHTPDISSAKIVARALQNGDVYPSPFGFALKINSL